ncbi:MAG TPA: hypothetical protein VF006_19300 [Longimicrobium sp.]
MQNRLLTAAAVALLAASACVKSHVPREDRVIPAGRYAYTATLKLPDVADSVALRGTLVLDAVTPDSVAGRWEVSGYDPELRENRWNVASYEVHARTGAGADSLTVIHHVKRGRAADQPDCRVSITRTGYHADGTCTLRLQR